MPDFFLTLIRGGYFLTKRTKNTKTEAGKVRGTAAVEDGEGV